MRGLILLAALACNSPSATIGFCILGSSTCGGVSASATAAAAAITSTGNLARQLSGLTASDLAGIGVLWILNTSNSGYGSDYVSNIATITSWVQSGGVLTVHDRATGVTPNPLPGGGGIAFTRSTSTNIDIQTAGTYTGLLTNTSLDGGNYSNHGRAAVETLPAGAIAILNNGTPGQIVDFEFLLGRGAVHYSSIPLDYYLANSSGEFRDNLINNYLPAELSYQAAMADQIVATPEPGTIFLIGAGLAALLLHVNRHGLPRSR